MKLRLIHEDGGIDIVKDEDLGDRESLGQVNVIDNQTGEVEQRHRITAPQLTQTDGEIVDDDYDEATNPAGLIGANTALLQLVGAINERHSPSAKVTQVIGGNATLVNKLAMLLNAQAVIEDLDNPAPAAVEAPTPVEAPAPTTPALTSEA